MYDDTVFDFGIEEFRIVVKSCAEPKTVMRKIKIVRDGFAEVADADKDNGALLMYAEYVAEFGDEFGDVIAVPLLAQLSKTAEILTYLRGG